MNKGETKLFCIENTSFNFYFQYEKKQIQFASNLYGAQMYKYLNKKNKCKYKQEIICQYNLTKSGVDLVDMENQNYKTQRRTKKWWKAVFFYILDVTLKNLSVIYFS